MEELLTPQICMDIDETPLDVGKDDTSSNDSFSESAEPEMDDDEKVKLLLEENFVDNAQVPEELTDFEKEAKKNVFAIGEPAVQFQRLHCTACNTHLGSAPVGHFNRYIHPLLKVLLCKTCYEFYCSGEFDKDEDGSEMYCRWCGQGGKVMCCAQCAYVFCQKCVRQNLGKRTLELIKDSDDWLCFGCNPMQLINLKIICTSLYEFVLEEIRLAKSLNNIERLKVDHSVCCQKIKAAKRKRNDDTTYMPHKNEWEEQKIKKPSILKNTLCKPFSKEDDTKTKNWNQKEEAEVVCTPDLPTLMEDDPPPLRPMPKSVQIEKANALLNKGLLNAKDQANIQSKSIRPEGKKLYTIAPKTNMMMICNSNNLQKTAPSFIRLQTPAIKFVSSVNRSTPIVNSIPAQITPGTKHEWYDKAATVVSTITGNLSATLMNLTKEQRTAKSIEQLASIHNKLQELLSSSVNSLIQVRKNLRTEFLADLNKLKFSNTNSYRNNTSNMTKSKITYNSANKENDDDDVIIVNSEGPPVKPLTEPPPLVKISSAEAKSNSRPYLKVRSVSQLLTVSSECITIPDDPPGQSEDVIAVEEKDPLALPCDIPEDSTSCENVDKDLVTTAIDAAPECDDDAIKIKNALTESRIEALVQEHMKLVVKDIALEELKQILSVRVLIATNFRQDLPQNRLKTADWFIDDIDAISTTSENNEANALELENSDIESTLLDNLKSTEDTSSPINNEDIAGSDQGKDDEEQCDNTKSESENENIGKNEHKEGLVESEENNKQNENNDLSSELNEFLFESEEVTNENDEETNLSEENGISSPDENKDLDTCDDDKSSAASDSESHLNENNISTCSVNGVFSSEQITTDTDNEVNSGE